MTAGGAFWAEALALWRGGWGLASVALVLGPGSWGLDLGAWPRFGLGIGPWALVGAWAFWAGALALERGGLRPWALGFRLGAAI